MQAESQLKKVRALKTVKVALVELGKHNNYGAWAGEGKGELGVVVFEGPGDVEGCPEGGDLPFGGEEAGAVEALEFAEEVFVGDPEGAVVAEGVV